MSQTSSLHKVRAAFMPLLDAAPLIVAARLGFAAKEGVDIALERETSWATLRDRIAVGHLDAAHMLAPMPIASNLGRTALPVRLIVPMALGYGGNTVTVSEALWQELWNGDAEPAASDAALSGAALAKVVGRRKDSGGARLTVGVVHTHSAHFYQIAYWLAACGVDPVRDIDIVVVPPPLTASALARGQIDAFCAGEPWGSIAEREARGRILLTNESIWRSSPEKVVGVRQAWYQEDQERTNALVRGVFKAAAWCDDPLNAGELVQLLASAEGLGLAGDVLSAGLERRRVDRSNPSTGFLAFARQGAAFPWLSHASWFYSQMTRWMQADYCAEGLAVARSTYRPDIHRTALRPLQVDLPSANSKVEGMLKTATPAGSTEGRLMLGPDTFFDGRVFDPDDVASYLGRSA